MKHFGGMHMILPVIFYRAKAYSTRSLIYTKFKNPKSMKGLKIMERYKMSLFINREVQDKDFDATPIMNMFLKKNAKVSRR
jgi:hypothetical protein